MDRSATPAADRPPPDISARLLTATVDGLRENLTSQMPAGDLRDYYRWGLDPGQPYHRLFLQATGATQLANLTAILLDGLVDEAHWPALTHYVAQMNVYQVYEVVSDDLGIGVLPLLTGRAQPEPGFGGGEHAPSSPARAQPEPGFGEGEHAPSSPARAQPEPGFAGGEHAPSSPVRAQPEPRFGRDEHAPNSPLRAQPEPGFGGGEHGPTSPVRAQPEPGFGRGEHAPGSLGPERAVGGPQRDLLRAFNDAMVWRLRGDPATARDLLAGSADAAAGFSMFDHSLAGETHRRLAAAFTATAARTGGTLHAGTGACADTATCAGWGTSAAQTGPAAGPGAGPGPGAGAGAGGGDAGSGADAAGRRWLGGVEFGLWAALVANVESCAALADQMAGNPLGDELRDGLINRYRAVSRTLYGRHLPLVELAALGAQAILVVPTLAYYVGAVAEVRGPARRLTRVVRDGSLPEALYDAAVLVRLLNDIGPGLLQPDPRQRDALIAALEQAYRADPQHYPGFGDLLLAAAPRALGSRLRKDLRYREFNVCLYGLRRADSVPEAARTLAADLDYFARLYALHRERLDAALRRLTARLGDDHTATLVKRFVRFHERLYANPYEQPDGDYRT